MLLGRLPPGEVDDLAAGGRRELLRGERLARWAGLARDVAARLDAAPPPPPEVGGGGEAPACPAQRGKRKRTGAAMAAPEDP